MSDSSLIQAIIETGKPILASLGMWKGRDLPQIKTSAAVDFLYCVSQYPTPLANLKLSEVDFANKYSGFSDHTVGITAGLVAFSRGARILEKHFTLDKSMYGPDHAGSATPAELKMLNDFRVEIAQCL